MAFSAASRRASASHPAWGEWIEIRRPLAAGIPFLSHPAWGEWIEIAETIGQLEDLLRSHPAWGEWIEMRGTSPITAHPAVSPRMG